MQRAPDAFPSVPVRRAHRFVTSFPGQAIAGPALTVLGMRWEQKLQHATLSDVGLRRQNNEDSAASHLCTTEDEFDNRDDRVVAGGTRDARLVVP